jgi:hypothetical protein
MYMPSSIRSSALNSAASIEQARIKTGEYDPAGVGIDTNQATSDEMDLVTGLATAELFDIELPSVP